MSRQLVQAFRERETGGFGEMAQHLFTIFPVDGVQHDIELFLQLRALVKLPEEATYQKEGPEKEEQKQDNHGN